MIICFRCRHQNPPGVQSCARCGYSLSTAYALSQRAEDAGDLGPSEPAGESVDSSTEHCVAYDQLREICAAASQNLLLERDFHDLLTELETYLLKEVNRFERLASLADTEFERARAEMIGALGDLAEAARQVRAAELPLADDDVASALLRAADADRRVGSATAVFDRLASASGT